MRFFKPAKAKTRQGAEKTALQRLRSPTLAYLLSAAVLVSSPFGSTVGKRIAEKRRFGSLVAKMQENGKEKEMQRLKIAVQANDYVSKASWIAGKLEEYAISFVRKDNWLVKFQLRKGEAVYYKVQFEEGIANWERTAVLEI